MFFWMFIDDFDVLKLKIKIIKKYYFNTFSIKKYFYKSTLHRITKHIFNTYSDKITINYHASYHQGMWLGGEWDWRFS